MFPISSVRPCAFVACCCLMATAPAQATSFSVLLSGEGGCGGRDGCDDNTGFLVVENPLYEESGNSGDNPLYEPSSIAIEPPRLASGVEALFTVSFGSSITEDFSSPVAGAFPFQMTLVDTATGEAITEFDEPFDVYFRAPRLDASLTDENVADEITLRFYDPTLGGWVVEDDSPRLASLAVGGGETESFTICTCTHLSTFSFGHSAIPEPSTLLLVLLGACGVAVRGRPWRA
ncbi:MAG: PEP-CTERM sorting domain-containing protein [Planctomycetota bacterium]